MDLRPDVPAITAPTLVLAGAEDPATPPEHGAGIAALLDGARLRSFRQPRTWPRSRRPAW
jgi:3-oxoadipate enol-lactonase